MFQRRFLPKDVHWGKNVSSLLLMMLFLHVHLPATAEPPWHCEGSWKKDANTAILLNGINQPRSSYLWTSVK